MTKSAVAGSLLLLGGLSLAVAGGGTTYRTPQEVFKAAKKALQREDWKGFCATLTDDSRDTLAGGLALMPLMAKGFAKLAGEDKEKEILAKLKPLEDVMTRHGLTEAVLNKMKEEKKEPGKDPEAIRRGLKKLVSPIKDRSAFIAEMVAAMKKIDEKKADTAPLPRDAQLKDLKITGDKAKANVVSMRDGKEKSDPIEFRRINGSWKIELPVQIGKRVKKGAPPPP
jgi:hypothetical protein